MWRNSEGVGFIAAFGQRFRTLLRLTPSDPLVSQALGAEMRPVIRGYVAIAGLYFLINALFYRVEGDPGLIPAMSVLTSVLCVVMWGYLRVARPTAQLDLVSLNVNGLVIANTVIDIAMEYQPLKLINFILVLPVFALCGATQRGIILSVLAGVSAFIAFALRFETGHVELWLWLLIAGVVTAFGLAAVIRAAMRRSLVARLEADRHRDEALHLAAYDVLTGLPNRREFLRALDGLCASARSFHLVLIDLDGFKPVNDIFGHAAGDHVLREAGRRMIQAAPTGSLIARLGGDEFALLMTDLSDAEAIVVAVGICRALEAPFAVDGELASLSASAGLARRDEEAALASRLLEQADYALYRAKHLRRGEAVLFDSAHAREVRDAQAVEQALRTINMEAELSVVFQPQYDLDNRTTIGFEALARWHSPRLGCVPADRFIPAAERVGVITAMTPVLLAKALRAAAEWPAGMRVSFNLSARDLMSPSATQRVCDIVRASGLDPACIEFEITETAMLTDFEQAMTAVSELKALGTRLSLDDFGAGYSNFGYLNDIEVDTLKIDQAFIRRLSEGPRGAQIVKIMLDMAATLGMDAVMEGVETEAQLHQLRAIGARYIQGYLIGRPIPADDVADYLAGEAHRRATTLYLARG
ncbi:bifunctional diguanylate cyclase/phosphodiesterase [Asticcacaulis sp. AND118]|uniref:putative bifunctional diguanylate cyclase/phosphodiesterase n=1 Tax=Asticcacaulis sp. AND118 TaxID=2840468 RepID=UPI001CFF9B11|nr:EAL domain-containing protein [Asticcacaulis sp. AND118]UDF03565.1 EAL domain-containing protein [Asticcacaulis sp. AND118]